MLLFSRWLLQLEAITYFFKKVSCVLISRTAFSPLSHLPECDLCPKYSSIFALSRQKPPDRHLHLSGPRHRHLPVSERRLLGGPVALGAAPSGRGLRCRRGGECRSFQRPPGPLLTPGPVVCRHLPSGPCRSWHGQCPCVLALPFLGA